MSSKNDGRSAPKKAKPSTKRPLPLLHQLPPLVNINNNNNNNRNTTVLDPLCNYVADFPSSHVFNKRWPPRAQESKY
ncbi:hypothetical protein D6C79_04814 [Aureobasidium pullulans]|nr:hypothetical protein D6C79_04814 [Aureobasidium pullulans]